MVGGAPFFVNEMDFLARQMKMVKLLVKWADFGYINGYIRR